MNPHWIIRIITGLVTSLALVGPSSGARAEAFERHDLGGHPVCEASAAVIIPCPHVGERCLLVGDNEEREHLFMYRLGDSGPDVASRQALSFAHLLGELDENEREISDIEALTRLAASEVLVVGSHSRNKSCKARKKRRRMVAVTLRGDGLSMHPQWGFEQAKSPTCKRLFGRKRDDLSGQRREVCAAIEAAEDAADQAQRDDSAAACEDAGPLNVEGAVAVPSGTRQHRVWLGLRTPLVNGKAVLLRHAGPGAVPAFDGTALVELDGWGIRDLTLHWGWVWLIAGPTEDDANALFKLSRFPLEALASNRLIAPEFVSPLPNGAEGLVVDGSSAIVLMDGDEAPAGGTSCRADATYTIVSVPLSRP
jgi:hypothetical protein